MQGIRRGCVTREEKRRQDGPGERAYQAQPVKAMAPDFDVLPTEDRLYLEHRLRNLDPRAALREVSRSLGLDLTAGQVYGKSREMEKRLRGHLIELQAGEGMSDATFEAWTERQVRQMAEESQTSARLQAINFLQKRRDERKYADEAALIQTILQASQRMAELEAIRGERLGAGGLGVGRA